MRYLGVVAILISVTSCVSYQPLPEGYTGPTAMIVDTMDPISSTRAGFFQITAVDGRDVLSSSNSTQAASSGQGFMMSQRTESRLVPSGKVTLSLEGRISVAAPILALTGGMYSIKGEVDVELESEMAYYVRGFLSNDYTTVWLEDNQGNVVSEKLEQGTRR